MEAKLVFDSNSLISANRDRLAAIGLTVHVPVPVFQELLYQAAERKGAEKKRSLAALRFLSEYDRVQTEPFFCDCVRRAFGLQPLYWPIEKNSWIRLAGQAVESEGEGIREMWGHLFAARATEWPVESFFEMKQNKKDFEREARGFWENIPADSRPEEVHLGPENPSLSGTSTDGSGAERTILESQRIFEMAAVAGIPKYVQLMEDLSVLGEEERGFPHFMFSRGAAEDYQGGLDFAIRIGTQMSLLYAKGQKHADANDFFVFLIMPAVDDSPGTVFVTEENRNAQCAELLGLNKRVVSSKALCG